MLRDLYASTFREWRVPASMTEVRRPQFERGQAMHLGTFDVKVAAVHFRRSDAADQDLNAIQKQQKHSKYVAVYLPADQKGKVAFPGEGEAFKWL
jgi:hypothetical protein